MNENESYDWDYMPTQDDVGGFLDNIQNRVATAFSSAPTEVDVRQGEWTFRVNSDGQVRIVAGSGTGSIYSVGTDRHAAVMRNLVLDNAIAGRILAVFPAADRYRMNQANKNVDQPAPPAPAPRAQNTFLPHTSALNPTLEVLPLVEETIPFYKRPEVLVVAGTAAALGVLYFAGAFDLLSSYLGGDKE